MNPISWPLLVLKMANWPLFLANLHFSSQIFLKIFKKYANWPHNPMPIITSQEEFSCTINLSDEDSATLWAICEGLEIVDGGENNV